MDAPTQIAEKEDPPPLFYFIIKQNLEENIIIKMGRINLNSSLIVHTKLAVYIQMCGETGTSYSYRRS